MAILALSSSSALQTVAIAVDGAVVAEFSRRFARREPRRLLVDIEAALAKAGIGWADLELLAADVGPGSFTGIRAGLATLRALAFAHELPCVGVNAAQLVADAALPDGVVASDDVWIALPSRSTTCFLAHVSASGVVQSAVEQPYAAFAAQVPGGALVVAVEAVQLAVEAVAPGHVTWRNAAEPSAATLARVAPSHASKTDKTGWADLVPYYVAASDAERNTGVYVEATAIPARTRAPSTTDKSTILPAAAT